ncbi:hypothetical protein N431DRAFT_478065 [Stipitochalara longipes BDJ]|nr:hypothetical protein N431DRAFT_478065 [Stipitochalara longipes BDJ]
MRRLHHYRSIRNDDHPTCRMKAVVSAVPLETLVSGTLKKWRFESDEISINNRISDERQRRTRSGETHWGEIRRHSLGFRNRSSLIVMEEPSKGNVDGGINSVGWRSHPFKEEFEREVRVKKEVKEEDDINDIVDFKRWPPSKRHDRGGQYY